MSFVELLKEYREKIINFNRSNAPFKSPWSRIERNLYIFKASSTVSFIQMVKRNLTKLFHILNEIMNIKFQVSNKVLVLSSQLTNKETTNIKQHLNMFLIFLQIEKRHLNDIFICVKPMLTDQTRFFYVVRKSSLLLWYSLPKNENARKED